MVVVRRVRSDDRGRLLMLRAARVRVRPGADVSGREKRRGDVVWYPFDTGAFGLQMVCGVVTKAGPRTYTVRWESDATNRLRQDRQDVKHITDPDALADARAKLHNEAPRAGAER